MKCVSCVCTKTSLLLVFNVSVLFNMYFVLAILYNNGHSQEATCGNSRPYYKAVPPSSYAAWSVRSQQVSHHPLSTVEHHNSNQSLSNSTHYGIAVFVVSSPGNLERRNAVRKTWIKGYSGKTRKYFVRFGIGTFGLSKKEIQELEHEDSVHKDLLLMPLVEDYYLNLGHKVLAGLVWFSENVKYTYLFKCDDDTFALLDKLEDELVKRGSKRGLYWGYFVGHNYPQTSGQWAEPNWRFCDTYFPYAYGGGYMLSADIVKRIGSNADALIVYNSEDVSVGAWTVVYDIERQHDIRFNTDTYAGCKNSYLVIHKVSEDDMYEIHQLYTESKKLCEYEYVTSESEYNWNMPPSQCYCPEHFSLSALGCNVISHLKRIIRT